MKWTPPGDLNGIEVPKSSRSGPVPPVFLHAVPVNGLVIKLSVRMLTLCDSASYSARREQFLWEWTPSGQACFRLLRPCWRLADECCRKSWQDLE